MRLRSTALLLGAGLTVAHAASPTNIAPAAWVVANNIASPGAHVAPQDNPEHPTRGAVDGVIGGHPESPQAEWGTRGVTVGASLCLRWTRPVRIASVKLYDRPNADDQVLAGELLCDDGRTFPVGPLANDGRTPTEVVVGGAPVKTLVFRVTQVSPTTQNAGLAECEVLSPDPAPSTPEAILPHIVYDENPGYARLHDLAWKLAMDHIRYQPGLTQPLYMDEACWDDTLWIWDTCFMALYCRYAADIFPGVESLENFYGPMHAGQKSPLKIQHPDNPPLFAWGEYDHYRYTGDLKRAVRVVAKDRSLQKHYEWFATAKAGWRTPDRRSVPTRLQAEPLGWRWNGVASGMDNTPRARDGEILWVDAAAQQGLAALYTARLLEAAGETDEAQAWQAKYATLRTLVNTHYWDPQRKFYYDIDAKTGARSRIETVAAYWPMFAEMATPEQAAALVAAYKNPKKFGGPCPFPTLARDDKDFAAGERRGDYWRGGVWLPTSYMAIKAFGKYGYHAEAREAAVATLDRMLRTHDGFRPASIWECYSPDTDQPSTEHGRTARPDFCGWSALGPISLLIEDIIGLHTIDAPTRTIRWRLVSTRRTGVTNLRVFGDTTTDLVAEADGTLRVRSDKPYTLELNDRKLVVPAGEHTFRIR